MYDISSLLQRQEHHSLFECVIFPCTKFKGFAKRWLKYGQDFIENQKLLKAIGEAKFLEYYNRQIDEVVR